MEHTLNRQTTTILTYINQGRRSAAFPDLPCPSGPAAGPVRGHAGPALQLSMSAGACAPPPPRAPGRVPPPAGRMDGWGGEEGWRQGNGGTTGRRGTNEYE